MNSKRPSTERATVAQLQRRIRVALGREAGDVLLSGGEVVNVFTNRVEPANVVVADGWIAGVGPFAWDARETIRLDGQVILPGLIDSHMHLESTMLTPAELARLIVPHGTTATISDSHEIGNVLGIPGIESLLSASADLPLDLYFTASSCVPAQAWEHSGAVLGPAEVAELLTRPRVLGLAEMMDFPAVLRGESMPLAKVCAALDRRQVVDGHAPGMTGRDLMAYVTAGIRSDHESGTVAEARAKAGWGMLVQVREGSIAHNLEALLPLLASGELGDNWTLVTDDVLPDDLCSRGHLDELLRRVVAGGVSPAQAVRHASLVPARHYGLINTGAVAPGYRADLVIVDDLRDFRARQVIKDGRLVAQDGRFMADLVADALPAKNTVHLAPLDESAFRLQLASDRSLVIRVVPGQLVTRREIQLVARQDGKWVFDPERDVVLTASVERHRATGCIGLGLVSGFRFRRHGALGSSVAHDSHNLVLAGTNAHDLVLCARTLAEIGGGFVVAADGEVRATLPLPVAGLLSRESGDVVIKQLDGVRSAARALGCDLPCPFGLLSFLALSVIPELRITDQGLWDVVAQQFVTLG